MRIWIPVAVIALGVLAACVGALAHNEALIHLGGVIVGGGLGAAVPRKGGSTDWLEQQAAALRSKSKEKETPTVVK